MTQTNLSTRQKQTHRHRKQTYGEFPVVRTQRFQCRGPGLIPDCKPHSKAQINKSPTPLKKNLQLSKGKRIGVNQEFGTSRYTLSVCACVCSDICNSLQPHGLCPPGFSVHGISQARILGCVVISFIPGDLPSQPRDGTHVSCASCIGREILYQGATYYIKYI